MAERTAEAVADDLLSMTGRALETGDFALFARAFRLPQLLRTYETERLVETEAQFRELFDHMRAELQQQGITRLVRMVVAARYRNADRIESTHVSHPFVGDVRVGEPYPVFSIIERRDGEWRIASADHAVVPGSGQARAIAAAGVDAPRRAGRA